MLGRSVLPQPATSPIDFFPRHSRLTRTDGVKQLLRNRFGPVIPEDFQTQRSREVGGHGM